jgi:hypothetical protein
MVIYFLKYGIVEIKEQFVNLFVLFVWFYLVSYLHEVPSVFEEERRGPSDYLHRCSETVTP